MAVQQQEGIVLVPVVPNAHTIGIAFVNCYYNVLVRYPQLLYKFYKDCSILSRPCPNDQMLQGTAVMKQQIASPDYSVFKVEIKTVDSQPSYNNGVLVLVSGSVTFKNKETRTFTQSFFLAPQENGYFVLNDMFRYVGEEPEQPKRNLVLTNGCNVEQNPAKVDLVSEPVAQDQNSLIEKPTTVVEEHAPVFEKVDMQKSREVPEGSRGQKVSATEHVLNDGPPAPAQETPVVVQDAENAVPCSVALEKLSPARTTARAVPSSAQSQATNSTSTPPKASSANEPLSCTTANMTYKNTAEGSGCSIFINNLPVNVTTPQVEEKLKKFGAIKPSGVQVKSRLGGGSSYAFIEFEEAASVQTAVEASPIIIGGRQAFIREKRPFREGFRNYGARGRGGYSYGGRGNGSSYFMNNRDRGAFLSGAKRNQSSFH